MASTILVKDVLYRVSKELTDVNVQFTRWEEKELSLWLNDGQRAIAKFLPQAGARIDVIKLAAGTRQRIDMVPAASLLTSDGSTAADTYGNALQDVIRNMGSDGATPGRAIRIVDRDVLDNSDPLWHTKSGTVIYEYTFAPTNPKWFYVNPAVPAATNVWVEISWMANPPDVAAPGSPSYVTQGGTSTVKISIDDKYTDDLVNYILARAQLKDAEYSGSLQLAGNFTQLFVGSINAQAQAMTGVNPELKSLPLAAAPLGRAS